MAPFAPTHVPGSVSGAQTAATTAMTAAVCDGAHDLVVERGPVMLQGVQTFDRVCVRDGGTLVATGALTLRVGYLDIAPDGSIDADGADGYEWDTHDCIGNQGQSDGADGYRLTIVARHATVRGLISSNGGQGLSYGPYCYTSIMPGSGGAGGSVALIAQDLTLSGSVTAQGGAGGDATSSLGSGPTTDRSGDGGTGGHVTIAVARAVRGSLRAHVDVDGGTAGQKRLGPSGRGGARGSAIIRTLVSGEKAQLPAAPPPGVTFVGSLSARQSLDLTFARSPGMRCGAGDIVVRRGATLALSGAHRYAHVCVENGGSLVGQGSLRLVAQTIAVARGGRIAVDGAGPLPFHWSDSGRYEARGACAATHVSPHAGVRGPAGELPGNSPNGSDAGANPGDGGGLLTLIARDMALDGRVSVNGGTGQDGWYVDDVAGGTFPPDPYGGGGGGSGGGIDVTAQRLQLGGTVSSMGGHGGHGLGLGDAAGRYGGPGCIKIFADLLRAPTDALPLLGQAVVGRLLPTDPVPPAPGAAYDAANGHNLGGAFLRFWRQYGGLDPLGAPQTEQFVSNGRLVQYTDRALLVSSAGHIELAPLGRQLITGRVFARAAPFVSSPARRYFPATRHSLSGRFLAYWRAHDGPTLLGAPLSEVIVEGNGDGSGRRYPLQWFERGRLEYHAEHEGTRYAIQLGLLGVESLRRRGWLPSASTATSKPSDALGQGGSSSIHLYLSTGAGPIFGSDGSRRWRFLTGPKTIAPQGCVNVVSLATADSGRTVYEGTCSGAVWRSRDEGRSWTEADRGLPGGNLVIYDLAVAPNQRTIYAAIPGALYKTSNAGATWSFVFQPCDPDDYVQAVALSLRRPDRLWVGTDRCGLYRSEDAGRHWTHVKGRGFPGNVSIDAIIPSPFDSADLYVSVSLPQEGVYRTRDGGVHWSLVHGPWEHPATASSIAGALTSLTFDPLGPGHIYASANDGVYTSRDDGVSWIKGHGLSGADGSIVVSHGHSGLAYALDGSVVYRTIDRGLNWQPWEGGDLRADDNVTILAGDVR